MTGSPVAVFRVDGGPAIGGGHVIRCAALAAGLRRGGWHTIFACRPSTAEYIADLALPGLQTVILDNSHANDPASIANAVGVAVPLLVVDHYELDATFESGCRPWAEHVLVIDDFPDRPHDCDFLLNASAKRPPDDHGDSGGPPKKLFGPSFALLRDGFVKARHATAANSAGDRLLVAFGATDPANATALALDAVDLATFSGSVDVVLGSAAAHLSEIRERCASMSPAVQLHVEPTNLVALISRQSFAIGAPGSSAWERCCLGLPTLLIQSADNQTAVAQTLVRAGAARFVGPLDRLSAATLAQHIDALASDAEARTLMSAAATNLCDGLGVDRARTILVGADADNTGARLTLRVATQADAAQLFDWQQQPQVRRFARNRTTPSEHDHNAWLSRVVDDPDTILCIIDADDEPVGSVRIDSSPPDEPEISIYVAPQYWRRGIASAGLRLARRLLPGRPIHAHVMVDNNASHALFTAAGYRQTAPDHYVDAPQ